MAITTEITEEHIRKALDHIDKNGVPQKNESDQYDLVIQNNDVEKKYPPKYVVAVARQIATGGNILTNDFTSTEARRYLENLKFSIAKRESFELTSGETEILDGTDTGAADDNPLGPRNLIYFGAPGTGKSFKLNQNVETDFVDKNVATSRYERVTFYPTYSYAQFVGCYKPVMKPAAGGAEEIAYEFVPGPFLRVLVNALNEKPGEDGKKKDWCLVIEEINRANAAAVFGDVFQLLDRGSDGVSEYEVAASEDVKRFLQEEFKDCAPSKDGESEESKKRNPLNFLKVSFKKDDKENDTKEWDSCRLRIPSNMYIWATMNSADQGVFPMDTAFKRRWEFEYIDIDNGSADCERWSIDGKYGYKWDAVRRLLNGLLSLHRVNEDKLMGAHFVKPEKGTDMVSEKSFKSKVLMYLWEDAARMCRRQMFGDIGTYSAMLKAWDENGVRIFSKDPELEKLKDAADTKKIFAELSKIAPRAESTQPKLDEQTQPDHEPTSDPAP